MLARECISSHGASGPFGVEKGARRQASARARHGKHMAAPSLPSRHLPRIGHLLPSLTAPLEDGLHAPRRPAERDARVGFAARRGAWRSCSTSSALVEDGSACLSRFAAVPRRGERQGARRVRPARRAPDRAILSFWRQNFLPRIFVAIFFCPEFVQGLCLAGAKVMRLKTETETK